MGGFIALTVAARHSSTIGNVVIVASRASGPDLAVYPGLGKPSQGNVTMMDAILAGAFPQGADDPGESCSWQMKDQRNIEE